MTKATVGLCLDLLMRSLTATLCDRGPNHDLENAKSFVLAVTKHYSWQCNYNVAADPIG
jgi:hypothetical protein